MTEHTALPWHASRKSVYVSDINHTCIAQMLRGQDENEANAALIIMAVNQYDAHEAVALAALEMLVCDTPPSPETVDHLCAALNDLMKAKAFNAQGMRKQIPLSPDLKVSPQPTVSSEPTFRAILNTE